MECYPYQCPEKKVQGVEVALQSPLIGATAEIENDLESTGYSLHAVKHFPKCQPAYVVDCGIFTNLHV